MAKHKKGSPPGRVKIMNALAELMKKKDFHSITTSGIAAEAGVTEGLIYKYFRDKKDLLYQVLKQHFEAFQEKIVETVQGESSSLDKLALVIRCTIESYAANRVFARILLLEVRSSPDYFKCAAYDMVKRYAGTILDIIRQGQTDGEISRDVDPYVFRQVILGSIEHACLREVIFDSKIDTDLVSERVSRILFKGVQP
ncbi:MAG: TetR/AcrR family transcriptional regulator [Desulfobacteraceae bacterium]|nr:TetR/AcrR family transcriptional regulator [Desulfobacteraceae bacterium]